MYIYVFIQLHIQTLRLVVCVLRLGRVDALDEQAIAFGWLLEVNTGTASGMVFMVTLSS